MTTKQFFEKKNSLLAQGLLQVIMENSFLARHIEGEQSAVVMLLTDDQLGILNQYGFDFEELLFDNSNSDSINFNNQEAMGEIDNFMELSDYLSISDEHLPH